MFPLWAQIGVLILTNVVGYLLAPKQPGLDAPKKSDLRVPNSEEGRPLAVHFGSPIIKDVSITWYGDYDTIPIKSKGGKK